MIVIIMKQENTNEYNDSDVRDFDDIALKHNIFIQRVYFKKHYNHVVMNLFKVVYFKQKK